MNADPQVMEFFPKTLSRNESDALAARIQQHFADRGFGLWAVEIPDLTPFAGFIGLSTPRFDAHFTPCTEVGWRLVVACWGRGFATEGAHAVLNYAFRTLELSEVVSMTAKCNDRSRRVMERIGMTFTSDDDFEHPMIPQGDRLSHHVLYRARRVVDEQSHPQEQAAVPVSNEEFSPPARMMRVVRRQIHESD